MGKVFFAAFSSFPGKYCKRKDGIFMRVGEIMAKNVVCSDVSEPVQKVAEQMKLHGIGAVPVCSGGKLAGMLTDRDIALRCVAQGSDAEVLTAGDIMSSKIISVSPEHSVVEAARLMARKQVRRLPVCENGEVVGMLSLGDLARARRLFSETDSAFCEICEDKEN